MQAIANHFASPIYRARVAGAAGRRLLADVEQASQAVAAEDRAGQAWCRRNRYDGYTSYASLGNLTEQSSAFADLRAVLDGHVARYVRHLALDLGRERLRLDSLWVNVLRPAGRHGAHIHPLSVVSGTFYVRVPPGSGGIRFEDPRLPLMMAAPPRRASAPAARRTLVDIAPREGEVLLWESFLRHEVLAGTGRGERISVSFNYGLGGKQGNR